MFKCSFTSISMAVQVCTKYLRLHGVQSCSCLNLSSWLGSPAVHERAPLIKSMLIAGPRGTGKRMLVEAICSEVGANLIDLSASNLVDKYPGKDGLKMLMHLIFKVYEHWISLSHTFALALMNISEDLRSRKTAVCHYWQWCFFNW